MLQFLLFCQFQLMIEFLPPFLGSRKCLKKQTNKQKQQQEKKQEKQQQQKTLLLAFQLSQVLGLNLTYLIGVSKSKLKKIL